MLFAEISDYPRSFFEENAFLLDECGETVGFNSSEAQKETILGRKIVFDRCLYEGIACSIIKGDNGKPYLKNSSLFFNVSHSNGFVAVGFARNEIGLDYERLTGALHRSVYGRVLSDGERKLIEGSENESEEFLRLWTLKEAALKFSGEGLSGGLKSADFSKIIRFDHFNKDDLFFVSSALKSGMISICSDSDFSAEYIHYDKQ